jgi:hypothetical protein
LIDANPSFFAEKYLFGDHQRWLLLASATKVKFVNQSLATRNVLPESATRSRDIKKVIKMLESVYELKMGFCEEFHCGPEVAVAIRRKHQEAKLEVAFAAVNREVAHTAYRAIILENQRPTMRERLFLIGASNQVMNLVVHSLIRLRSKALGITHRGVSEVI